MAREYAKLNLNKMTRVLSKLNKSELIDSKKVVSKGIRTAQSKAKESNCYYCGTPCSSFCNSHTIPAFSLRNIAQKGKLFSANKVIEMRLVEMEKGVKAAGTFQIICKSCDNTIFQEYENPENYLNEITSKMLAQIHLKNTLKMISQRKMEIQLYANIQFGNQGKFKNKINQMDLTELEEELAYAKRKINKSYKGDYQIIFHKKLDYVIPIAFQGAVVLPIDLKGAVINNIYNANPKHKMKWIQMAILPMEATSEIILFVDKGNIRYREFRKQLNSVDSLEKN
ncbi:hypothetical protein T23_05710 [Turicibacter faecis]|uniref:Uncharacterized protein n=1 Tax=Turicibacter faecis TaxID=2963365 RepID=A0ABM8ILE0_9FIRM|nr:hypothetical protein T23_05710 [Turicibacter sp. TC023]